MGYKRKTQWPDEFLAEFHPSKNGKIKPQSGNCGNRKILWWTCKHGHSWQASLYQRQKGQTCPKCSTVNTSFPEQVLFDFLRVAFPDAENRADVRVKGKRFECDILIPSLRFAIEYDGPHHIKKVRTDSEKNRYLQLERIQLVRIRQDDLPDLEPFGSIVIRDQGSSANGLMSVAGEICNALVQTRAITVERMAILQDAMHKIPESVERAIHRLAMCDG